MTLLAGAPAAHAVANGEDADVARAPWMAAITSAERSASRHSGPHVAALRGWVDRTMRRLG